MPSNFPLRYFLYARKSTESEDRQVASISSQIEELKKFAEVNEIKIEKIFTEEKSAKAPGRPIFNQMLDLIDSGKADAILCWKLDRLARNPIDGGKISWMLQKGTIKNIQTFQKAYLPADNVLMMSVEFGMANQFILDLSSNTKRGQRESIRNGWYPHKPPIGYLNNKFGLPDKPPIFKDPILFDIVKKLWDLLIEKKDSIEQLHEKALSMGLRTTQGQEYPRTSFYNLFRNPFYYGNFLWNGKLNQGKHEPMVTKTEFDLVQKLLDSRGLARRNNLEFAFTGLIRCGECGASITAEHKVKHQKNGNTHFYTYYRCTKRIMKDCTQKTIRSNELETQILNILERINIPPEFHQWAIKYLKEEHAKESVDRESIIKAQQKSLESCRRRLDNLLDLRINDKVSEEEFDTKKASIIQEKEKLEESLKNSNIRQNVWIDKAEALFNFAETAKKRFETGNLEDKHQILKALGSNLLLKDRILSVSIESNLALFLEVAPEVQKLHNRLEPLQPIEKSIRWDKIYSENPKWGG